jgi:hypothetical protein
MRMNKKLVTGVATGAIVLAGSGVALAYWTAEGHGPGYADTASGASKLAVAGNGTISNIFPGDKPQEISGTIFNQAPNSAYVHQVVATIGSVYNSSTTALAAGCDASDFTIATPTMLVDQDIASQKTVTFKGATIQFNNKPGINQDGCKGVHVFLNFVAS